MLQVVLRFCIYVYISSPRWSDGRRASWGLIVLSGEPPDADAWREVQYDGKQCTDVE